MPTATSTQGTNRGEWPSRKPMNHWARYIPLVSAPALSLLVADPRELFVRDVSRQGREGGFETSLKPLPPHADKPAAREFSDSPLKRRGVPVGPGEQSPTGQASGQELGADPQPEEGEAGERREEV